MRTKRHTNNDGRNQIKRGGCEKYMRRLAAKLRLKYGAAKPSNASVEPTLNRPKEG